MKNLDFAIKFTNEKYCTIQDVKNELKTPLVDSIWSSILEYRKIFSFQLPLKHINNINFSICLSNSINDKISSLDRKLTHLMVKYFKINNTAERNLYKTRSYVSIIKSISKTYNLNVDEAVIENIINNNISILSPDLMILYRYYKCLLEIEYDSDFSISDELFSKFYEIMTGTTELTSFYRKDNLDINLSKTLIGKSYLGVPFDAIEKNMNQLFDFVNKPNISLLVKAICSFYFLYYTKPFDSYSEEIAILLMKKIIAINDLQTIPAFINLEDLLTDKEELENKIITSQKTYDLTYLLVFILDKCEILLQNSLDLFNSCKNDIINKEINQPEELNILNSIRDIKTNEDESNEKTNNIDNNFIKKNNEHIENDQKIIEYNKNIAINNMPTGLNEADATKLENHLLELNPNLTHGQAYFYARHCTIGMNYTISQYKKSLGCAYETARTSMDNLVYLGYYRKELLKNKYIYTPVLKG